MPEINNVAIPSLLEDVPPSTASRTHDACTKLHVAIIGGGVSGVAAARIYLQEPNVQIVDSGQVCQSYPRRGRPPAQVLLFEQTDELAGVWASNYHKYAVQTPCRYYSFPDAPLSPDHDFTDGRMMKKYVKDYAHKHGVDQVAHLRSRVLEVEDLLEEATETAFARKWKLRVEHSSEDGVVTEMVYQVDQVLIATGVYSRTEPHVPIFPGAEDFVKAGGEIVHSVNFNGDRDYSGQHVVTVGYGKSAFDSSLVAKKDYGAKSSTILFREAHWPIPRKILGLIPFEYATFSRIGCALLNPEYQFHQTGRSPNRLQHVLHDLLHRYLPACVLTFIWYVVETLFALQFGFFTSNTQCRPKKDFLTDFWSGHGILPSPDFFDCVSDGTITAKNGAIRALRSDDHTLRAELTSGEVLPCDNLVLATGFRPTFRFLGANFLGRHSEKDGLWLYRNMLLPEYGCSLVFLNSNTTTFTNIVTGSLQARWGLEALLGRHMYSTIGGITKEGLPSAKDMQAHIETTKNWKRTGMPCAGAARAYMIQTHQVNYYDELLQDLGVSTYRKPNFLRELLDPYCSEDYKEVVTGTALGETVSSKKAASIVQKIKSC